MDEEASPEGTAQSFTWRPLRFQDVALVDPAALKETVAHHGLAEQKNEDDQDGQ
jgi:hypothetical protein